MKKIGRVISSSLLPMKPEKGLVVRLCVGKNSGFEKLNDARHVFLNDENILELSDSFSFVKNELFPKLIRKYHLQCGMFQVMESDNIEERDCKLSEFMENVLTKSYTNDCDGGPLFLLDVD
ncbi:hypothetical protein C9374_008454 [Naegleria lovaniensis]|uniref:Uncharacterized protein n=1 Tax=Naegleria lovaniensis TaxID=51637 RepID=A0AA88KHL8_NAELO|nr:uncharacterized protein C9374_008454 [Naegleria lovaniensis]KAG2378311.1 hypothetical protein C9374_008454 [Naegleria lovaniensis]